MKGADETNKRPTILIVDDTPENIALISSLLKESFRMKVATEGETALRLAAADGQPDLILLDVMMPGMDGYEVCRRLKENPKTADIPVIFLTAKTDMEDERRGLELGAVDYIAKPISPPIVTARVSHPSSAQEREGLPARQERVPRAGGPAQDPGDHRDPGRDHGRHGFTCGNTGQRNGKPHQAHPALRESARVQDEGASALGRLSRLPTRSISSTSQPRCTTSGRSAFRTASS